MAQKFEYLCNECQEPLVYIEKYKVCPRGHGKLIPTTADERSGPEYKKRRIKPADLSGFSIPPAFLQGERRSRHD